MPLGLEWSVAHLVEVALARLAREHALYHEALSRIILEGLSWAMAAEQLGRSGTDVRNHVHRGRQYATLLQ